MVEPAAHPVELLWSLISKDNKKSTSDRMKTHIRLGCLINAFNAWIRRRHQKA